MSNRWLQRYSVELNTRKLSQEEKQNIFESVQEDIERHKKQKRFRLYLSVSAIACIALIVVLFRILSPTTEPIQEPALSVVTDTIITNQKDIQLVIAGNQTMTFKEDADIYYNKEGEIVVNSGDEQIKTTNTEPEKTKQNTLIVPKGKRSSLTLADGTKVWVNSGSTLIFPASFQSDKREIRVEGEIYIEVTKDKTRPFYVNTSRMEIEVVGTRFNVMAYEEDVMHSVVLVEGGVDVNVNNEKVRLQPDYMLSVTPAGTSTQKVSIYDYISWKDGLMQFSNEPLSNILTRLSRYYDVPISCDQQVKDIKCDGKLVLFDHIEDVLETIYHTVPIQYMMEEDSISIKKR